MKQDSEDDLYSSVLTELRTLGVKVPKIKKLKTNIIKQEKSCLSTNSKIFGVKLSDQEWVSEGGSVIPKFVAEATAYLRKYKDKEIGLFRKGGSIARQRDLKSRLENGESLEGSEPNDVASLLKQWLRELPESLVPVYLHDLFLRCQNLETKKNRITAVLLCCLLLLPEHLYTLKHLLEFLAEIAANSDKNKMDTHNLALMMAPNILASTNDRVEKSCKLGAANAAELSVQWNSEASMVQLLIENSSKIGEVPDNISLQLPQMTASLKDGTELNISMDMLDFSPTKSKRKRRSGPMQDLFSGIRKFVGQNLTPIASSCRETNEKSEASQIFPRQTMSKSSDDLTPMKKDNCGLLNGNEMGSAHSRRKSFGLLRRKEKKRQKSLKSSASSQAFSVPSSTYISPAQDDVIELDTFLQKGAVNDEIPEKLKDSPLVSTSCDFLTVKTPKIRKSLSDDHFGFKDNLNEIPKILKDSTMPSTSSDFLTVKTPNIKKSLSNRFLRSPEGSKENFKNSKKITSSQSSLFKSQRVSPYKLRSGDESFKNSKLKDCNNSVELLAVETFNAELNSNDNEQRVKKYKEKESNIDQKNTTLLSVPVLNNSYDASFSELSLSPMLLNVPLHISKGVNSMKRVKSDVYDKSKIPKPRVSRNSSHSRKNPESIKSPSTLASNIKNGRNKNTSQRKSSLNNSENTDSSLGNVSSVNTEPTKLTDHQDIENLIEKLSLESDHVDKLNNANIDLDNNIPQKLPRQEVFIMKDKFKCKKVVSQSSSLQLPTKEKNKISSRKSQSLKAPKDSEVPSSEPTMVSHGEANSCVTPPKINVQRRGTKSSLRRGKPNSVKTGLPSNSRYNNGSSSSKGSTSPTLKAGKCFQEGVDSPICDDVFYQKTSREDNLPTKQTSTEVKTTVTTLDIKKTISTSNLNQHVKKHKMISDNQKVGALSLSTPALSEARTGSQKQRKPSNSDSKLQRRKQPHDVKRTNSCGNMKVRTSVKTKKTSNGTTTSNVRRNLARKNDKASASTPALNVNTPPKNYDNLDEIQWTSGRKYLDTHTLEIEEPFSKRESIVQILKNNAGNVHSKVQRYDHIKNRVTPSSTGGRITGTSRISSDQQKSKGSFYYDESASPNLAKSHVARSQAGAQCRSASLKNYRSAEKGKFDSTPRTTSIGRGKKSPKSPLPPVPKFVITDLNLDSPKSPKPSYPLKELTNVSMEKQCTVASP